MDESELEKRVGDILVRKRKAGCLLYDSCTEIAYGPLTIRQLEDEDEFIPVDFDGRVYETIKLMETDDSEEQINHLVTEFDARVAKHAREL